MGMGKYGEIESFVAKVRKQLASDKLRMGEVVGVQAQIGEHLAEVVEAKDPEARPLVEDLSRLSRDVEIYMKRKAGFHHEASGLMDIEAEMKHLEEEIKSES